VEETEPVATADRISEYLAQFSQARTQMVDQLRRAIVGQTEVIEQILAAIFTRGHCLLVGVPGLAKTLMVSSLSQILDVAFKRIQFTPDLMPSDILGTEVIEEDRSTGARTIRFIPGPIFANIILADEINRTPPKTQSALLEAMQEYQVTVGGKRYPLARPLFVLATQNPIEQEGTYPLPEAQLDRFMLNIVIGYPTAADERAILAQTTTGEERRPSPVATGDEIERARWLVRDVIAADNVVDYAARLVRATRPPASVTSGGDEAPEFVRKWVRWGAGPRAGQALLLAGKARAVMHGRPAVSLEDVRSVAAPVLRHRVLVNFEAEAEGVDAEAIVWRLLEAIRAR